jgi:SAM-dependent methyltransferase
VYQSNYFSKKADGANTFGYVDYDADKAPMRPVFLSYLERLGQLISGRTIFDIGAATGFFLDLARGEGWQTAGIELSDFAAAEAVRRGHQVSSGRLTEQEITAQYDVVTMWDVLEHVDDPQRYVAAVSRLVKPGGYVAINTVDATSWWARLVGRRWHLLVPPEHLFYYGRKNLDLLLRQHGFEPVEYRKVGKKFSLSYFFKIGYDWQGLSLWRAFSRYFDTGWWRHVSIPFNLRDNIFVLAKKKHD